MRGLYAPRCTEVAPFLQVYTFDIFQLLFDLSRISFDGDVVDFGAQNAVFWSLFLPASPLDSIE
jgi:hypothetical protein